MLGVVMNDLVRLPWRAFPAAALLLLGLLLALRAVLRAHAAWSRPLTGTMQPLSWMRGFRSTVIGLAVMGVGAAWLWHLGGLLAVSLVVGGEEALESSIAISALSQATPVKGKVRRPPLAGTGGVSASASPRPAPRRQ